MLAGHLQTCASVAASVGVPTYEQRVEVVFRTVAYVFQDVFKPNCLLLTYISNWRNQLPLIGVCNWYLIFWTVHYPTLCKMCIIREAAEVVVLFPVAICMYYRHATIVLLRRERRSGCKTVRMDNEADTREKLANSVNGPCSPTSLQVRWKQHRRRVQFNLQEPTLTCTLSHHPVQNWVICWDSLNVLVPTMTVTSTCMKTHL